MTPSNEPISRDLLSLIAGVGGTAASTVRFTFECMEVAEEEIAAAKRRFPRRRAQVDKAFKILCPPPSLQTFSVEMYRAHAREIIARVARGQDTRPGTKAEVLGLLSRTSEAAPLNPLGFALAMRLFREVFPEVKHDASPPEPWEGACDEELAVCVRKTADEGRVL